MPDTSDPIPPRASGLRTLRYGEVLLVRAENERLLVSVYNTFPLNDCPHDAWTALEPEAIALEHGALAAVLNGPRYWLMDFIGVNYDDPGSIETFGDLQMYRRATIDITSRGLAGPSYSPVEVDRRALFGFEPGTTVFELIDAGGTTYVMQAWSQQVDPTLGEADLHDLGTRLALPAGWGYRARALEHELLIDTRDRPAVVLQDELQNSYSLVN
jgi:hypothetical protein